MNMVRHDDSHFEVELLPVVVQTAFKHDGAHGSRKYPATVSAERNKMLAVINLEMRQLSAIKSLRHKGLCGDSRHRLSAERSSAAVDSRAAVAVGMKIFGKLERANPKLGISLLARKASFARPDSRWRLSPHDSCSSITMDGLQLSSSFSQASTPRSAAELTLGMLCGEQPPPRYRP